MTHLPIVIPAGFSVSESDLDEVDRLVGSLWDHFRGAHILITGGTGFFGRWLVESLLWSNRVRSLNLQLTILSRDPATFLAGHGRYLAGHPNLAWVAGSVSEFKAEGRPFTKIIHAASESNISGKADWPARQLASAIDGTRNIIALGAEHRIDAFLLTSSGSVYLPSTDLEIGGRFSEGPSGLTDYTAERHIYGQSKKIMEIMTAMAGDSFGFRATIARCFAFVGPHLPLNANYAIGNFIRDVLEGRQITVSGDGTPLRSYLYASDLAAWLLTILARGSTARPYNVGGAKAYSIGEIAAIADSCSLRPQGVSIMQTPSGSGRPNSYLPDVGRAERELGLLATVPLRDAIERTLHWHRHAAS